MCLFRAAATLLDRNTDAHDEFNGAQAFQLASSDHDDPRSSLALTRDPALRRVSWPMRLRQPNASKWDGDARRCAPPLQLLCIRQRVRAGIEIRMTSGWHYGAIPAMQACRRASTLRSQNLKSVEVLWRRRPSRTGLTAIGYTGNLIWPLAIVPQDRTKPVTLRLKLDYAVCEKLCVPAEAKAELVLNGKGSSQRVSSAQGLLSQTPSAQEAALIAAEARVPRKLGLGEGATLAVRSVRRENGTPHARVIVDVAAPAGTGVALFGGGTKPGLGAAGARGVDGARGRSQRFAFDLDGAPPGAKYDGAAIRLTAVAGDEAIEVVTHLD
jgi:DsbC/DsbD-like thiol-disulfide interchange protein